MPIYEYICKKCNDSFELLVRESTVLECPSCGSRELKKEFSAFAVNSQGGGLPMADAPPGCASCEEGAKGSCPMMAR
jgi:putative FmdB family regulatory protein